MSSRLESNLRKELRGYDSTNGYRSVIVKLGSLRKKTPIQHYGTLIAAFKTTAPIKARYYLSGGRRNYTDILYQSNIETLSLANEISFSAAWLIKNRNEINSFISFRNSLQENILRSNFDVALDEIGNFIERNGWSVWATELYFFLYKTVYSFDKLKELTETLISKSSPKISSLLFSCLLDRNDENYSVEAFFSKWKGLFSNINQKALREYLSYRAVTQVDDLEAGMASVLSVDVLNSIYDCYETLVDACATTIIENLSSDAKKSALRAIQLLIDSGINDGRLYKIFLVNGDVNIPEHLIQKRSNIPRVRIDHELDHSFPFNLNALSKDIMDSGYDAEESLSKMLHLGVNLKALELGSNLINFVFKESENDILIAKQEKWESVHNDHFDLLDCIALNFEQAINYISALTSDEAVKYSPRPIATHIIEIFHGQEYDESCHKIHGKLLFWLGVNLVKIGRYDEVNRIVAALGKQGKHWARESRKLHLVRLVTCGELELAIESAAAELTEKKKIGNELTLPLIFKNKKWKEFSTLDPVTVGIVAFCSNSVESQANILHICRMACRAIHKKQESLESVWTQSDSKRKQLLRYFYKNVWVEENLSLTDISTSQQARLQRIETLQRLFTLDSENEKEYAEEIKTLTLHQTLWLGLKHIDESRIFVNEPAILRWAEKELSLDYERWKRTETAPPNDSIIKNAIDKFFSENSGEAGRKTASTEISTEQDILIISIVERLINKFLLDPADGMNSYLSSRIRHGSLKGTILGPLEEEGLLIASPLGSELEIRGLQHISAGRLDKAAQAMNVFANSILDLINSANSDIIRVHSVESPAGKIFIALDRPVAAKLYSEAAKVSNLTTFVGLCFETFWAIASKSLDSLSNYFSHEFKQQILVAFNEVIEKITSISDDFETLISSLRAASTATQLQCDVVASWFLPARELEQRIFSLDEATEIAIRSTRNVYRLFNAKVIRNTDKSLEIPLTAYGLTTIFDCLYVALENSWKHSGLGSEGYEINTIFSFDTTTSLLCIEIKNPLSPYQTQELKTWRLSDIRRKIVDGSSLEFVSIEGGSGIPKLVKISRFADRSICTPLSVFLDNEESFCVKIYIPLYKRGEAYDAYYQ